MVERLRCSAYMMWRKGLKLRCETVGLEDGFSWGFLCVNLVTCDTHAVYVRLGLLWDG